jgi:FkbM family methyltransferase
MGYEIAELRRLLDEIRKRLHPRMMHEWIENGVEMVYSHILRPDDVAIDLGAHRGRHTIPMAALVGGGGRVYAVEASSVMAEKLRAAINHCAVPQARRIVQVIQVAVGDETGPANFIYIPAAAGMSGLRSEDAAQVYGGGQSETVQVERVDDLVAGVTERIAFIKLDIEGAELAALRGAVKTLNRFRPVLTLENNNATGMKRFDYTTEDFFRFFESISYRLYTPLGTVFDRAWAGGPQPVQLFATPAEMADPTALLAPAMIDAFSRTWQLLATP